MKSTIYFTLSMILMNSCGVYKYSKEKDLVGKYRISMSMIKVIDLECNLELKKDNSFDLEENMDGRSFFKKGNWSIDGDIIRLVNIKDNENQGWVNQSYLVEVDSVGTITIGRYKKIKN